MRLNKYISETGVCSRREADTWIAAGRVTVNGAIALLGTPVDEHDQVQVDGQPVGQRRVGVYIAVNKPVGVTCTSEAHVRGNIVDFIGHPQRIFPIGRLDKDSDGLILLTNNGDIVNQILRVENGHEKEYVVTVDRALQREDLWAMEDGVPILDTVTRPCRIQQVNSHVFRIILTQGLNRQIRRMCAAFEYQVRRLTRVRIGNIELGALKSGHWRNLEPDELQRLLPGQAW